MENKKKCFKCGQDKFLSDFYVHKQMGDGHLNKCIDCTKKDVKKRSDELLLDPEFVNNERKRHRDKYYRLNYKDKHKPTCNDARIATNKYKEKYPEKYKAKCCNRNIKVEKGFNNHHWSYNKEHYKDVVHLEIKDHMKLHRFLIYDQERFMYRCAIDLGTFKRGELLDTRKRHLTEPKEEGNSLPF